MAWFILSQMFSTRLTLLRLGHTSDKEKDLEILILRQQLNILQRKLDKPIKPNRAEKLTLAVLSANLKQQSNRPVKQFRSLIRMFQPETDIENGSYWMITAVLAPPVLATLFIHPVFKGGF